MPSKHERKPVLLYLAGIAIVLAAIYLSFELGRYQAGYSLLDERREVEGLQASIADRDATADELRRQIAILETSREIDRETYAAVEKNLAELQERIQAQEEELVFYRGIVSPGDGVVGLRIQSVEILTESSASRPLLRLLLVQSIVHNDRVTGTVRVTVSGQRDGEAASLSLAELVADGEISEIPYGFRYFQSIEQGLVLPDGFEPEQVEIEIRPREPRGDTVTQSFPWSPVEG